MGFIFETLFYQPLYNLLMFFYSITGHNLGLAIILIALLVKVITIPLTRKQIESGKKMKIFQEKSKQVKEKFQKNKEKMNEELMKLTSKYMPAQLAGCLPLIISIIFLIQVRNVVIHLVNQGYESFNKVAYVESLKFDVDSATFKAENLKEGENNLHFVIEASNSKKYDETITFINNPDAKAAKEQASELNKGETDEQKAASLESQKQNRESGIAVHIPIFDKARFVTDPSPEIIAFFRPPSNQGITSVRIELNGEDVTDKTNITKGEELNLNFLGMDLSKVGTDFTGNWVAFIPYLLLSMFIGITQFLTTKLQMGLNPALSSKKPDKKKPKARNQSRKEEEPDLAEIMQQSSQQMVYVMPIMTSAISLGFLGGANFFPTAVSLFWTANNLFVIIQQAFNYRSEIVKILRSKGLLFKENVNEKL